MSAIPERILTDPSSQGVYGLLGALVSPRPIAWVSTKSATGVDNIAPHSFYQLVSTTPPIVMISSMGEKDTVRNIRHNGQFVVCGSAGQWVEQINATATEFGPDVSEFDMAGLTREPSQMVTPCRVAESPYALECHLVDIHEVGNGLVVYGQVVLIAVSASVMNGSRVDMGALNPIARLSGSDWSLLGQTITIDRMSVDTFRERYPHGMGPASGRPSGD